MAPKSRKKKAHGKYYMFFFLVLDCRFCFYAFLKSFLNIFSIITLIISKKRIFMKNKLCKKVGNGMESRDSFEV